MSKIEIYTTNACIFCDRAKEVFKNKNLKFSEYNIFTNPKYLDELLKRSNGLKKMPQIFINNQHIGGFDKLQLLIDKGLFDKIISL